MDTPAPLRRAQLSPVRALRTLAALVLIHPGASLATISIPANTWVAQAAPGTVLPHGLTGSYEGRGWNHLRYDPVNGQMILFDGYLDPPRYPGGNIYANSLWQYDPVKNLLALEKVDHWTRENGQTVALPENATDPTPFDRHAYACMVLSASRNALYLWSGANNSIPDNYVGDMWSYSLAQKAWRSIPGPHPFTVYEQAMVCDPYLDKLVLFGGSDAGYHAGTQTWLFDLKSELWTNPAPVVVPEARAGQTLCFDGARRVTWMFGGSTNGTPVDELWRYDAKANTWTQVPVPGDRPGARRFANMAYDSKHDVILLFGGVTGSDEPLTDTWVLHPASPRWEKVSVPTTPATLRTYAEDMDYDSANDVFVLNQNGRFWLYQYDAPSLAATASEPGVQFRLLSTNPARHAARMSFTLGREADVRIDVVDSLGRRLSTLARGRYPAGEHEVEWDGGSSRRPASGIYYARLTAEGQTLTRRLVLVR